MCVLTMHNWIGINSFKFYAFNVSSRNNLSALLHLKMSPKLINEDYSSFLSITIYFSHRAVDIISTVLFKVFLYYITG